MNINNLIPTQCKLRLPLQIPPMIRLVKQGGIYDRETLTAFDPCSMSRLISLAETEDGKYYVMDGHHRIHSIFKAGRKELDITEYNLHKVTYAWFLELNPAGGWYTPFDPRTHVRLPDLTKFKRKASDLWAISKEISMIEFLVKTNFDEYATRRKCKHIRDLS
jgi:hypothetical protein